MPKNSGLFMMEGALCQYWSDTSLCLPSQHSQVKRLDIEYVTYKECIHCDPPVQYCVILARYPSTTMQSFRRNNKKAFRKARHETENEIGKLNIRDLFAMVVVVVAAPAAPAATPPAAPAVATVCCSSNSTNYSLVFLR